MFYEPNPHTKKYDCTLTLRLYASAINLPHKTEHICTKHAAFLADILFSFYKYLIKAAMKPKQPFSSTNPGYI